MNYYNEHDAKAASWLRVLIKAGLIPAGVVDERSIVDVKPNELYGFTQCHFFAGIGGWPLALKLAGWPEDKPVWTGSCPCQPFSTAGRGAGVADERHLWPAFKWLIEQCGPATIFGEQVASKAGREWLAGVFADLENMGYQRAGADLCAAGTGAPHIRQRLWWMAHHRSRGCQVEIQQCSSSREAIAERWQADIIGAGSPVEWLGNNNNNKGPQGRGISGDSGHQLSPWEASMVVECRDGKARRIPLEPAFFPLAHGIPARVVRLRGYGNAIVPQVAAEFILAADEAIIFGC